MFLQAVITSSVSVTNHIQDVSPFILRYSQFLLAHITMRRSNSKNKTTPMQHLSASFVLFSPPLFRTC
jgi:hypothetical protein